MEPPISIKKEINAPIEKVWQAWTDPALIMKWFGSDPNGKVLQASLDVRPGGYFEIIFKDSDLTEHTCVGIYMEVQELDSLQFSWMWKSEPGAESLVSLSFTANGQTTQMYFEHANTGNSSKHEYLKGWQGAFSKLERMLTT